MSPLADRVTELRRILAHLRTLQNRVTTVEPLLTDLSTRHDVLFSLMMAAQLVVDISSQLSTDADLRFGDYTEAVHNLRELPWLRPGLADELAPLPGFRNVVVHEYVALDPAQVLDALHHLEPVEEFGAAVAARLSTN